MTSLTEKSIYRHLFTYLNNEKLLIKSNYAYKGNINILTYALKNMQTTLNDFRYFHFS